VGNGWGNEALPAPVNIGVSGTFNGYVSIVKTTDVTGRRNGHRHRHPCRSLVLSGDTNFR